MIVRFRLRLYLLALVILGGFTGLLYRLWGLQIDRYDEFKNKVPGSSEVTIRVPGVRGKIRDRNGVVLATNEPNRIIMLNLKEVLHAYKLRYAEVPSINSLISPGGMLEERNEPDIAKMVDAVIVQRLAAPDLKIEVKLSQTHIQNHYGENRGLVPYVLKSDLTYEEFSRVAERSQELPGLQIGERPKRTYTYGAVGGHLLGYLRLFDDKRIAPEELKKFKHYVGDDYGVAGIEKTMNDYLTGKPGVRILERGPKGKILGELGREPAESGADVYLTIDARIQFIVERAMRNVGRGAAVVLDPSTGDILAMVSVPSYDPNEFIFRISQKKWDQYNERNVESARDRVGPMINRAVLGYAPGSTYKLMVALAGFLGGGPSRTLYCDGATVFGKTSMHCWKREGHGSVPLERSIKVSCNDYYYQYGMAIGIKKIVKTGKMFGLGKLAGIGLPQEKPGVLPGPDWLRKQHPGLVWTPAATANTSIGQGKVEASPMQMASVVATIANGGKSWRPRLVAKVVEPDGAVSDPNPVHLRADLAAEGIPSTRVELIRRAMFDVVNEPGGTGGRARLEDIEFDGVEAKMAGKTGSAQTVPILGRTIAWFTGFAPYDNPKYAIAVMVQGGESGGKVAGPLAKRIMEETLSLQGGYRPQLSALPEAPGRIEYISELKIGAGDHLASPGDEGDTAVETTDVLPTGNSEPATTTPAEPSIEPSILPAKPLKKPSTNNR